LGDWNDDVFLTRCCGGASRSAFGTTRPGMSARCRASCPAYPRPATAISMHLRVSSPSSLCVPAQSFRLPPASLRISGRHRYAPHARRRSLAVPVCVPHESFTLLISRQDIWRSPALMFADPENHDRSRTAQECDPKQRAISRRSSAVPAVPVRLPLTPAPPNSTADGRPAVPPQPVRLGLSMRRPTHCPRCPSTYLP
jgi:hypothetical protein